MLTSKKVSTELRRSDFVPRQRCQTLNTEVHAETNQKQKDFVLNEKITSHEIIKSRIEGFIDSFNKLDSKLKSVITKKYRIIDSLPSKLFQKIEHTKMQRML